MIAQGCAWRPFPQPSSKRGTQTEHCRIAVSQRLILETRKAEVAGTLRTENGKGGVAQAKGFQSS